MDPAIETQASAEHPPEASQGAMRGAGPLAQAMGSSDTGPSDGPSDGPGPDASAESVSELIDLAPWPELRGARATARLWLRATALPTVSMTMFAWYLAGRAVRWNEGGSVRWRNRMVSAWGRAVVRLMGARVTVHGAPPESSLLVSNHLSYVDIPLLASSAPTVFVSKAEVARWPGIGLLARSTGTIFVQRENKRELPNAAAAIAGELRRGSGVVLFPEGTSGHGGQLLPFRPSLLDPAARGELPVAYASVTYRTPEGSPEASQVVCWWGDMPFGGHVTRLLRLPFFHAEIRFGSETLRGSDRKDLSSRLWHAVKSLSEPVP